MLTTIPISALEIGIDFEGYVEVAKNIGRMLIIPLWKRKKILEEADKKLPKDINKKIRRVILDMANDKEVYNIAGIPYCCMSKGHMS